LYKFTFIVFAAFLTLEQLKIAQNNYQKTLEQLIFTQKDINNKKDTETTKETLLHCQYYFTEIQYAFKELTDVGAMDRLPVAPSIKTVTNSSLRKNESLFKIVSENTDCKLPLF
jgi:hypothetical protein